MEKILETKQCKNCQAQFQITDWDQNFYDQVQVPRPTHCPDCRAQRREAQFNQLNLFKRKCNATQQTMVSNYPPESPYTIYNQEYWHSDKFDGLKYGKDYDFSKPFFQQFLELKLQVPQSSLFTDYVRDENSEYTNSAGKNKNSYINFDTDENYDCLYSYGTNGSTSSLDCYRVQKLELCYEVVDCKNCYNCYYVEKSDNCADSIFLNNCIGCKNCIYCSNLKNKQYHIFNEPVSKENFQEIKKSLGSYKNLQHKLQEFHKFKLKFPQRFMRGFQNENVTGDYLVNCKNSFYCFDSMNMWDAKYCNQTFMGGKNFMDCEECGDSELIYESGNAAYNCYNIRFSTQCMNQMHNATYCHLCFSSHDLFGCAGLKRNSYCILNKQYSKEEYEELVPRIIEHMKTTEEWGEFFPIQTSAFPYNLTMAQDRYPLTKEQATTKGYAWRDHDPKEYLPQTYEIPDHIVEVPDTITNEILACTDCKKNYKITTLEYRLYRQLNLPIPRECFHCRHKQRRISRNPRRLHDRTCDKCNTEIQTTYAPQQPEIVYCKKCYQDSMK
jgi:hypothetical protein